MATKKFSVFALIVAVSLLKLPETSRWLILQRKDTEAFEVLETLSDWRLNGPLVEEMTCYDIGVRQGVALSFACR